MPTEHRESMARLKAVEREFRAARHAAARLKSESARLGSALPPEFSLKDLTAAAENLEGTFLIRLFSEFEAALKSYLRYKSRKVPDKAEHLINRVRSTARIDADVTMQVHEVRRHRNTLVHDAAGGTKQVALEVARSHLCRFLCWLRQW